jgi:hypothetical protein
MVFFSFGWTLYKLSIQLKYWPTRTVPKVWHYRDGSLLRFHVSIPPVFLPPWPLSIGRVSMVAIL